MSVNEKMTAIADAIRDKTGGAEALSLDDMASSINEVHEAGKQAQYDEFWDIVQNEGKRIEYNYSFARWSLDYLDPKYVVCPKNAHGLFLGSTIKSLNKEKFDLSNVKVSPSGNSSDTYTLCEYCNKLEEFPDIGLPAGFYGWTFADNYALHTIEILRFTEDVIISGECFRNCKSLVNLTIEGVIGRSFPISYSPLSITSLKSIITHLKSYVGTDREYTYTVTFKTSAFESLEVSGFADDDKTWLQENNITYSEDLTWSSVISELKWNLTLA